MRVEPGSASIASYDDDGAEAEESVTSMVPTSKLEASDLRKAYKVRVDGEFVVTDSYGNEHQRFTARPSANQLIQAIDGIEKKVEKAKKDLLRYAERAEKAKEAGNAKGALTEVTGAFKKNLYVGHEGFDRLVAVYQALMEEGREALEKAVEAGDLKAIAAMITLYAGTDLAAEIKEANAKLRQAMTKKE